MLFITHLLVGAALGKVSGNPYVGVVAGILSHHLIDALPHFDQGSFYTRKSGAKYLGMKEELSGNKVFSARDWSILFMDAGLGVILFGIIILHTPKETWLSILSGGLGGLLPDIIDSSPLWSEKLREKNSLVRHYNKFHSFFHWTIALPYWFYGLIPQIIFVALSFVFLLR